MHHYSEDRFGYDVTVALQQHHERERTASSRFFSSHRRRRASCRSILSDSSFLAFCRATIEPEYTTRKQYLMHKINVSSATWPSA